MATSTPATGRRTTGRTLAIRGALAVALSLVVNLVVLQVVLALGLAEPFEPLSIPPVAIFTALGAIGATVVYALLDRYSTRPDRTFTVVAGVVLALSFLPDLALLRLDPAATVAGVVVLMGLHVTVAAICVVALTGRLDDVLP